MDQTAVFVDAGYLLAASAELLTGSPARSAISISHQALVTSLIDMAEHHGDLRVLRVYWYDGAKDAVPNQEHLILARLPRVKLRLGRMTMHGQKGVDSLIVLDLLTLARERAMTTAYLVSGDEDIREGVAAAQQMGVRVVLVGVPTSSGRPHQADSLIREADEHTVLDRTVVIDPHIRQAAPATPTAAAVPSAPTILSPRQIGHQFGETWLNAANSAEVSGLCKHAPRIPSDLDGQLFREAEQVLGSLRGREEERRELRAGFWDAIISTP